MIIDYPTEVNNYLEKISPGKVIEVSKMKHPNRFLCAFNYLGELGLITNQGWSINNDWTKIRKHRPFNSGLCESA